MRSRFCGPVGFAQSGERQERQKARRVAGLSAASSVTLSSLCVSSSRDRADPGRTARACQLWDRRGCQSRLFRVHVGPRDALERAEPVCVSVLDSPWWRIAKPIKDFHQIWSGKRDSNSRPRPWQGRALPTELFPPGHPSSGGSLRNANCRDRRPGVKPRRHAAAAAMLHVGNCPSTTR